MAPHEGDEDIESEEQPQPHPRARELFLAAHHLHTVDIGPLDTDTGHDAFYEFPRWRRRHPTAGLDACIGGIAKSWNTEYGPAILDSETIQKQIDAEEFDFYQNVTCLDETVIATALAQLFFEGGIDGGAKPTIQLALQRQLHPLVLRRMYRKDEYQAERLTSLTEVRRMVEASSDVTTADRDAHVERLKREAERATEAQATARELAVCPWPVDSILAHVLPSGKRLLLHLCRMAIPYSEGEVVPTFYVLDWRSDVLPAAGAVNELEAWDDWTFNLELPPAERRDALDARKARLESVLQPTGLAKHTERRGATSRVPWERLDEYLVYNYDGPGNLKKWPR